MLRWGIRVGVVLFVLVAGVVVVDLIKEPPRPDYATVARTSALNRRPPAATGDGTCSGEVRRWLVVGWDGAGWEQLLPLLDAGRLPNLARLIETGAHGDLLGFKPSLSPALWTTVATGRSPKHHGITGFDKRKHRLVMRWERLTHLGSRKRELYGNGDRKVRALWNLLDDAGRDSLIVGFHNSYPAEKIRGAMVSNWLLHAHMSELMRADGDATRSFVHPEELRPELLELARRTRADWTREIGNFVEFGAGGIPQGWIDASAALGDEEGRWPYFVRRAWWFDTFNAEAALSLMPRIGADLTVVHFQSADLALHQFLFLHQPELFGDTGWDAATLARLEAARPRYANTVTRFFEYLDLQLGRLIETAGPQTSVLVLSDHGFEPHTDPWSSGHHEEAPPGFWAAAGPGVRRGLRVERATLRDIFPTLAATLGLPLSDRLEGQVLSGAVCAPAITHVADYEDDQIFRPTMAPPPRLTDEIEAQLESLGYLR
jgi:arylsulfatase A-like enzyme